MAEEIAGPLGADFQIGAREEDWSRIAPVIPPPPLAFDLGSLPKESPALRTFTGPAMNAAAANTPEWRRADMGATNGHGNARSVARILSAISLGGTVNGVKLLSPETIALIFEEQSHGVDLVLGVNLRFGIGYALPEAKTIPYVSSRGTGARVCFWGGWGGSLVVMDTESRVTVAYTMNKMAPGIIGSDRSESYVRALHACLS